MNILISGAGVAGPVLAYWLARAGHQLTLVEQAPRFRTGGYIIDFWGAGYTIAERMGILPQVLRAGYPVREVRFVDGHGRKAGGFSTDNLRATLDDRFTSLPRGDLSALAYRAVEGRVETLFGTSIVALDEDADGVSARLTGGDSRRFDLVIGADGLHSRVRQLAFGPQAGFERSLGYYVAAFEVAGYRPRDELVYVSYGLPGLQISRFSKRDDRTMFLFVFLADRMDGPEPHDLDGRKAVLHRIFDDAGWEASDILRALDPAEEVYFDRVSQIVIDRWSKGRIALVGDAAACVSLLAGEGAGLAMVESYVLAGELARDPQNHQDAFRRYEERLRPLVETKQKSARDFAASFAPRTAWGIWLRNQVTKAMAVPGVARLVIGASLKDNIELPDYRVAQFRAGASADAL